MFFKHNKPGSHRDDIALRAKLAGKTGVDDSTSRLSDALRGSYFDGFPYFVTRFGPAIYHISVLPDLPPDHLREIAARQFRFNRFESCLVTGPDAGIYYHPDGEIVGSPTIPTGGMLLTGGLKLCCDISQNPDVAYRQARLSDYIRSRKQSGFLIGNLFKDSRAATRSELTRLSGRQKNGIPKGLSQCDKCGDWRGECLELNPNLKNMIVRVRCRCENVHRCAACGELLSDRTADANYYKPEDGKIWYVPGFAVLKHRCKQGK